MNVKFCFINENEENKIIEMSDDFHMMIVSQKRAEDKVKLKSKFRKHYVTTLF